MSGPDAQREGAGEPRSGQGWAARLLGRHFAAAAALLAATAFLLACWVLLPALGRISVDVTENRLHSLSPASKEVLGELIDPVTLVFAYSRETGQLDPEIAAYAQRVDALLSSLARDAEGKLVVERIDPKPFSPAEDTALEAGLRALQTPEGPIYLGIAGSNLVDDRLALPFLYPEREASLEYDLIRTIARLDDPVPSLIGVASPLPGMDPLAGDSRYSVLEQAAASYRLLPIDPDFETLPDGLDVLWLVHPAGLELSQWAAVSDYLSEGGSALIQVDPAAREAAIAGLPAASDLGPLENLLGVQLGPSAVADTALGAPVSVRSQQGRLLTRSQPLYLLVPPELLSEQSPLSANLLRGVTFAAPGGFSLSKGARDGALVLAETTPAPGSVSASDAAGGLTPSEVVRLYEPQDGAIPLAVQVAGPVQGSQVLLIADTDMLADIYYIDPGREIAVADNAAFLLNGLEALSGSSALTRLRSRAPERRPLERVESLLQAAEREAAEEREELSETLSVTQERLSQLAQRDGAALFSAGSAEAPLTPEEATELDRLRADVGLVRSRLRAIERGLRADIDRLEARLRFFTLWLPPLLVLAAGLAAGIWRRRRRSRAGEQRDALRSAAAEGLSQ